ncbi:Zn-dependent exopeptidase [Dothidotthia symphoricarpi CBS 119687]|uniref:Carboxypeptidase M14B n=1 Tax=Dothidotthia symphoricarpi CBS 119687 TaxID=1392245 RepID=A0A6A6A2Y3_9PLEO|nr:Zn-dependent exopeptidase [Dothidotthia symphoricarpi CBS 119687]KAF2125267.1 Zn-dependent exopeptidase [Dothidotthia symphoricarpi CBS 119687]
MAAFSVLLFAAAALAQTEYGNNHVTVNLDAQIVEQNAFPAPKVTLYSPAFSANASFDPGWSQGTEGATSHEELELFLSGLATKNPSWMTYKVADFLSEEGHTFPYVYLSSSSVASGAQNNTSKLRVWIQGSVHGNEPAGDEATLALLGAMDQDPTWAAGFLEKMDIVVLPRYNPDGNAYFQRTLATNYDPNRDHTKLARQQTRDIKKGFSKFAPHIAIDMHEYTAGTRYAGNYSNAADGMFSAAKNLNIHASIRNLSESLFAPAINASLTSKSLRGEPYITAAHTNPPRLEEAGTDAKIGRNAMGLTQCITFLFETRGIGIASQSFARRTQAGLQMMLGVLETARDDAETVYTTIENAIADVVASREDIIVTDYTTWANRTYTMVDRRSGVVVQIPVEFASTTPAFANLTRSRPAGYIIPRAWADLAERLKVSGLEVETMRDVFTGQVEAYNITSSSLGTAYYEGAILNTVTTQMLVRDVMLPAGSFFVSTRQKNAGLAFVALEPENIDSYVSFSIVAVEVGDVYPVFRVI